MPHFAAPRARPAPPRPAASHAPLTQAFRKSYRKYETIEKSKAELKDKYVQAKRLGAEVNDLSTRISALKNRVQQIRAERAATGQVPGAGAGALEERARVWATSPSLHVPLPAPPPPPPPKLFSSHLCRGHAAFRVKRPLTAVTVMGQQRTGLAG